MAHVAPRYVPSFNFDYSQPKSIRADVPDQPAIVRQYMRYTAQILSVKNVPKVVMRALQLCVDSIRLAENHLTRFELNSATSDPRGPTYLWARREVLEEESGPSTTSTNINIMKWPSIQPTALNSEGTYLQKQPGTL